MSSANQSVSRPQQERGVGMEAKTTKNARRSDHAVAVVFVIECS